PQIPVEQGALRRARQELVEPREQPFRPAFPAGLPEAFAAGERDLGHEPSLAKEGRPFGHPAVSLWRGADEIVGGKAVALAGGPLSMEPREPLPEAREIAPVRSEEHTSELQSRENLVCRLLL